MMALVEPEIDYIDKATQTIHYKGGIQEPLSEEASFSLFASPKAREIKEGVRQTEREFGKSVGGEGHTFLKNLGDNFRSKFLTDYIADPAIAAVTAIDSSGREGMGYFDRLSENYLAHRMGRREATEEFNQENPKSAMAGMIGSLALDIGAPLPKAIQSRPILGGAAIGAAASPRSLLENPEDVAKGALIGGGIGAAVSGAERVARQRGALRAYPEEVRMTHEANRQAQDAFRAELNRKLESISSDIPKAGLNKQALEVEDFINSNIKISPAATGTEARSTANFIQSIEGALPENLDSNTIRRVFDAIEGRIAQVSTEEAAILDKFKSHLVQKISFVAGQVRSADKYIPKVLRELQKSIQKSISTLVNDAKISNLLNRKFGTRTVHDFSAGIMQHVDAELSKMPAAEILRAAEDGSLPTIITEMIQTAPAMSVLEQKVDNTIRKMEGRLMAAPDSRKAAIADEINQLKEAQLHIERINQDAMMSAVNSINKYAGDIKFYARDVQEKLGSKISNAIGIPNPNASRNIAPTNPRPTPSPIPPAPNVGNMARKFENPNYYRDQVKNLGSLKSLGSLGALTYGLGVPKAVATGAVAGYQGLQAALRGITRPDAIGNVARQSIQRGGIDLIVDQIRSYPSYSNGILLDPQDRRDAVAEIEVDPDIPIEDKAVLQAKINRGISLEKYLESIKGVKNGN